MRSELIAQTLFKSGDIESQGTGVRRIKDFCDEEGIQVEYVHVVDGTKLIFYKNDAFGQSLLIDKPPNVGIKLNERESKMLDYVSANPSASASDITIDCGIATRTVQRNIKKLKDSGLITREGSKKTGW